MIMKIILGIITICGGLGLFFGVHEWMENRYEWKTVAAEVKQQVTQNMAEQNRQMNYHITEQQRDVLEQRLEKLNEKYKGKPMPAEAKELKDDLQKRLDKKEKELKSLEKK